MNSKPNIKKASNPIPAKSHTPQSPSRPPLDRVETRAPAPNPQKPIVNAVSTPKPKEPMAKIALFYDGHQYKDPLYVCVNGEELLIPRGQEIKIPQRFKKVVDWSIAQDMKTTSYHRRLEQGSAQGLDGQGQNLVNIRP